MEGEGNGHWLSVCCVPGTVLGTLIFHTKFPCERSFTYIILKTRNGQTERYKLTKAEQEVTGKTEPKQKYKGSSLVLSIPCCS